MFRVVGLVAVWVMAGIGAIYVSGCYHRRAYPEDIDPVLLDRETTVTILITVWFLLGIVGTLLLAFFDRHL
jgi:hypothetical protein